PGTGELERELAEWVAVEVDRGELPARLHTGLLPISTLRGAAAGWRGLDVVRGAEPGTLDLGFEPVDAYAGRIDPFSDRIRTAAREASRVLDVTPQDARL